MDKTQCHDNLMKAIYMHYQSVFRGNVFFLSYRIPSSTRDGPKNQFWVDMNPAKSEVETFLVGRRNTEYFHIRYQKQYQITHINKL